MKKRIFVLSLLCIFGIFALPANVSAAPENPEFYSVGKDTVQRVRVVGEKGHIRVILLQADQANIKVYQILGATVANMDVYAKETIISVSPGVYIVEVFWRKATTFGREVYKVAVS